MRTKDVRPWWWWVNPWLYIKRRDAAYDTALATLYELCLDAELPERRDSHVMGEYHPERGVTVRIPEDLPREVARRCRDCGRRFIVGFVKEQP